MRFLAIDPGDRISGVVWYDAANHVVEQFENEMDNSSLLLKLRNEPEPCQAQLVIEDIQAMGMAVGKTVFETKEWIGRFREAWESRTGNTAQKIKRTDVKIAICGKSVYTNPKTGAQKGVTDGVVRRAVLELFPATGGGVTPEIGTKKKPGPLYGMKSHTFQALAVAITAAKVAGLRG